MVNFKSPVGGIIYRPLENKNTDIHGEEIDFDNLLSYRHQPVQVETPTQGYQKQYRYGENKNIDSVQETTQPSIRLIVPTSGNLVSDSTTTDFLSGKEGFKKLEQLYVSALQKRGIDSKYAKWLTAQDALESGWGKSQGSKRHNYGNITTGSSWNGDSFIGNDHDAENKPILQKFRSYGSVEEYIEDKLNLLQTKRYNNAFVGNVDDFIDRVFNSGYAVDPKYVQKVKSVYNNLT